MFYYTDKFPKKGTMVVAMVDNDKESVHCVYVILPEYNNVCGIIYQNELPKRLKQQKKAIADMKHAGHIVCVVTNDPKINADGEAEIVELSIKGIDIKYHADVLTRIKNIERLLKILKFISIKCDISFDHISKKLRKKIIKPLTDINENDGIDNYDSLYKQILRDINVLLSTMSLDKLEGFDSTRYEDLSNIFKSIIKETDAETSLLFDIFIWKDDSKGNNAIQILRNLFAHVLKNYEDNTVEIRYIGAPRYQIHIRNIALQNIETKYNDIKYTITKWLTDNNVDGYDLRFDQSQKEIIYGDVSITFPFQIDIN